MECITKLWLGHAGLTPPYFQLWCYGFVDNDAFFVQMQREDGGGSGSWDANEVLQNGTGEEEELFLRQSKLFAQVWTIIY